MFKVLPFSLVLAIIYPFAWDTDACQTKDPLMFPKDNFTVEKKTVNTSAGEKKVTYHSYMHIPYVANPVDKDYQSMDVSVPVKINDTAVDASNAPILFVIGVGGYMSVNNARSGMGGKSGGPPGNAGRMKGLPAFDDFTMRQPESNLFGNRTTDPRHFTNCNDQPCYQAGEPEQKC